MSEARRRTGGAARARRERHARVVSAESAAAALTRADGEGAGDSAARTIWIALALLAAARLILPFVPGMWAWSLNLLRFVSPAGWMLGVLSALAVAPALARPAGPALARAGDAMARRPAAAAWGVALAAALLVWLAPDRVRFVGDFLMRQGTVEVAERPAVLFPQALRLDVLIHYGLPRFLVEHRLLDANGAARLLGVIEAGLLGALAVAFARVAGFRAAAAVAAASVLFFGGYLGMFTGFSKAFAELSVLTAAAAVFGLWVVRRGRGLLPLGVTVALAVALHRSGLALLPAAAFAWWMFHARHAKAGAWRAPSNLAALAIPIVTLAIMVPRIVAVSLRWDAGHFAPEAGGRTVVRTFDLLNLIVLLSPLAPLVPMLAFATGRRLWRASDRRDEAVLLVLLALPFVAVMPFLHPAQGLFRDWDDFAATGVAVSAITAWLVGWTLASAPRASGLALAVCLGVAAPTLQWLIHHTDVDRGFARVRAFMLEPPPRSDRLRGSTWDFLGIRNFRLRRWDAASEAFAHAAETAPSPRILQQWALTESLRGNVPVAQRLYRRLLEKSPENSMAWLGLAAISARGGDYVEARRAANAALRLHPGDPEALEVLEEVERREAME